MIPSDFSDYFKNCTDKEQQAIVEELLTMSSTQANIKEASEVRAISCPHCQSKSIRANGRLNPDYALDYCNEG